MAERNVRSRIHIAGRQRRTDAVGNAVGITGQAIQPSLSGIQLANALVQGLILALMMVYFAKATMPTPLTPLK